MMIFPESLIRQKSLLQGPRDLRYSEMEELNVIADLLAEFLDPVELRLEIGIISIDLGPEPEIIAGVAVRAIVPCPDLILIKSLPQDCRVFQVIPASLPLVDERIALFFDQFLLLLYVRIVVAQKKMLQVPDRILVPRFFITFIGHSYLLVLSDTLMSRQFVLRCEPGKIPHGKGNNKTAVSKVIDMNEFIMGMDLLHAGRKV